MSLDRTSAVKLANTNSKLTKLHSKIKEINKRLTKAFVIQGEKIARTPFTRRNNTSLRRHTRTRARPSFYSP